MRKIFIILLGVSLYANIEFYTYSLKLNYKEYVKGQNIDKDYSNFGNIVGLGIKYSNTKNIVNYYLKSEYLSGDSYYHGVDLEGKPINAKQNGFYLLDLEAGVGKYFYFFIGYREWNR
jgi:hypothetical protein